MHILIIPSEPYLPPFDQLAGIFQSHQAKALARNGHQVGVLSPVVASLRMSLQKWWRWPTGVRIHQEEGVDVLRYFWLWRLPRMPRLNLELWLLTGMNLFAKYVDLYSCPQVIHSHNALYAGALARKIKEEWRVPYVNTEHSSAYGRGLLKESELALSQRVFAESGAALVVSPQLGRDLEKVLPSKEITYKYVPNVLPRQFEEAQVELSNEHEQRPTGSNNFRFLNIASFDRNKAHADLLRAFAGQFGNAEGTTLRIGGDGPLRSELENLARKLGIEQRVVFLGKLSRQQVMIEMRTCDAFVLSSHYETFGVVLIEALACGKPVIATRCGGPETVVNETNGLLVPVNNLEALGQAMAEMKHYARRYDPAFLRAQCLSRFGEKTIVSQLETVYQETLEL